MSGNNFVTKHILKRRVSEHRPYEKDNKFDSSSSSSSDEGEGRKRGDKGSKGKDKKDGKGKDGKGKGEKDKPEWVQSQDPYGRPCWHNRKTGQMTYGNGVTMPPPVYAATPAAASAVPVGPPGYMVPPGPYMHSPVGGYGHSPVAMYPTAPWNASGAAPAVPMAVQVPDYVKKQIHAEQKKKEEEARKKLEKTGTWQRHYSSDGTKYWQNTASGRKLPMDPYK